MADEQAMSNKTAAKNAAKASAELKKQKKKKWCPIFAPEIFQGKVIGEVLLDDASQLMNRSIKVNMMQLLGDMKKQNVNVMFKVYDVKEGKGLTRPVKFEISPFSLRRLAKREKDKLSDSFVVKTSDGKLVRIKPLMITNNMTKGAVKSTLIKSCRAVCKEIINTLTFDQIISELVQYKLQKQIRESLHKVYPLKNFEIRMLGIETKKKKETVEEEMLARLAKEREEKQAQKVAEEESESGQEKATNTETEVSPDDGAIDDSDDSEESEDDSG